MNRTLASLVAFALIVLWVPAARGQCSPQWLPGDAYAGIDGYIFALTNWRPNDTPMLVAAGLLHRAGRASVSNIAVLDGGAWRALGPGLDERARAVAVLADGSLVVGGEFTHSGPVPVNHIARWDGNSWSPMGDGMDGAVLALAVMPNGDLIAGGGFTSAGGQPASCVARWDGSAWHSLGSGVSGGGVKAMAALPNGDLVIGGTFAMSGQLNVNRVARWDGGSWHQMGSGFGPVDGSRGVNDLKLLSDGRLIAVGDFLTADGVPAVGAAAWNGSAWIGMNGFVTETVQTTVTRVVETPMGEILCGGILWLAGSPPQMVSVSQWNGSQWQSANYPSAQGSPTALLITDSGDVIEAGGMRFISHRVGSTWQPLVPGTSGTVYAIKSLSDGDIIAAGSLFSTDAPLSRSILRRHGTRWEAMGDGVSDTVFALTVGNNGDIFAGGHTAYFGNEITSVGRWDGSAWHPMGVLSFNQTNASVYALATLPNGDIVAGGTFNSLNSGPLLSRVGRWDGAHWNPMGSGFNNHVQAMLVTPEGSLFAAGNFTASGAVPLNHIARWNGSAWEPLGLGTDAPIYAIARTAVGHLLVAGEFSTAGGTAAAKVARWDGAWHAIGEGIASVGYLSAVAEAANGDILVGGSFVTSATPPAVDMARFDGTSWRSVGTDFGPYSGDVWALSVIPSGDILVGSSMLSVNGALLPSLGRLACQPCYPNCDGSTFAPMLSAADFQCFLNEFSASLSSTPTQQIASYSNCDGSLVPPVLTVNDFQCFINKFAAGCP